MPPTNPISPATANNDAIWVKIAFTPKEPRRMISMTVNENTIQNTSVNADSNVRSEYNVGLMFNCFKTGMTNAEDTPPSKKPVSSEIKIENPLTIITIETTREETIKLNNVKTKLCENSFTNDVRLMLNAPSNKRNKSVNVVKTGANVATFSG